MKIKTTLPCSPSWRAAQTTVSYNTGFNWKMNRIKELQREEVRSKKRQIKTLEREIGRLEELIKEEPKV